MPTQTTAVRYHLQPLRRRSHLIAALDLQPTASPSFSSADSSKNLSTDTKADDAKLKELVSEDESHDDDLDDSSDGRSPEPPEANPVGPSRAPASPQEDALFPPDSRPWYQSNFPILVAVASPLANWFTGTDYIKNLFLVALVVFYFHQLIEGLSFLYSPQTSLTPLQSHGRSTSNRDPAHVLSTSPRPSAPRPTTPPASPHPSSALSSSSPSSSPSSPPSSAPSSSATPPPLS